MTNIALAQGAKKGDQVKFTSPEDFKLIWGEWRFKKAKAIVKQTLEQMKAAVLAIHAAFNKPDEKKEIKKRVPPPRIQRQLEREQQRQSNANNKQHSVK